MHKKNSFFQQEVNKKIYNLRLKLNKAYEEHGNIDEVIKISQELDKYIVLAQQQLIEKLPSGRAIGSV